MKGTVGLLIGIFQDMRKISNRLVVMDTEEERNLFHSS